MATKTLTFEEVNAHVEKYMAAQKMTTAPEGGVDLCSIYKVVRPILVLASQAFFIPQTWRSAISTLIAAIDALCPQDQNQ